MARGRFERYGDNAETERRAAIEDAEDLILGDYPLNEMPVIEAQPGTTGETMDWIDNDPAGYEPDEQVFLAGQAHGWYQVQAVMEDNRFDDDVWNEYLRELIVEAADEYADIDPRSVDLAEDQLARLAVSLALFQRGLDIGRSEALKDEDIDRVKSPKNPERRMQWLGAAGVGAAGVIGLVAPGGFEPAVAGTLVAGGAEAFRVVGVEKAYQLQTRRALRGASDTERHNAIVAQLEKLRDCPDPEHLDEAALRFIKMLERCQAGRTSLGGSLERTITKDMELDPQAPVKKPEDSGDELNLKSAASRIAMTAGMGFTACALALGLQHSVFEDNSAQDTTPSSQTNPNAPPVTVPRPLDRVQACAQIVGDQDGNPRTPNTVKLQGVTVDCPPAR